MDKNREVIIVDPSITHANPPPPKYRVVFLFLERTGTDECKNSVHYDGKQGKIAAMTDGLRTVP
jgi:hypothetical protein